MSAQTVVGLNLSVFVITLNEQRCIARVISQAKKLSDDVVVIDSGSTDETVSIAESLGARVFHQKWLGYGQQKRFGEDCCKYDVVLNLDADEVLSNELVYEIKAHLISGASLPCSIKVTTVYPYQDKPRLWADYNSVVRLYNKNQMRFREHATWDTVVVPDKFKPHEFKNKCYHYSFENFEHYIFKLNRYTSFQRKSIGKNKKIKLFIMIAFGFPWEFFRAYILKRHFTGGLYGIGMSMTRAYFRIMKYLKQLEKN